MVNVDVDVGLVNNRCLALATYTGGMRRCGRRRCGIWERL